MKIFLDEDLPKSLTKLLREKGYEVFDVRESGLRGASDDKVFDFAQEKQAILMTADLGFSNITRFPVGSHNGVIVLRFSNEMSVWNTINVVAEMLNELDLTLIKGSVVIFSPHKIRIRRHKPND